MKGPFRIGPSSLVPYLYVAPALLPLILFVYVPLARTIEFSLFDWNLVSPERAFVGLHQYERVLGSEKFWEAVRNTIAYATSIVAVDVVGAVVLAIAVLTVRGRPQSLLRAVAFLPTLISMAVAAVVWLWIFHPIDGVLNRLLALVDVTGPSWFSDPTWAIWAVAAVATWKYLGYNFVVALAALSGVPRELEEAAQLDGATRLRVLWHVVLPHISPTLLYLSVTGIALAAQIVFVPIHILTRGGPYGTSANVTYFIFEHGFRFFDVGFASAAAVVVFAGLLAVLVAQLRLLERSVHYAE